MKVQELVEMYRKNNTINLSKVLDVKEYISISYKKKMSELILDECIENKNGFIKIDSLNRYILFTILVVSAHTNLEFYSEENDGYSLEAFDLINENGLLEKVIDCFKKDYDSCQVVLDMMTSDLLKNQETIEEKIYNFINKLESDLKNGFDGIENKEQILNSIAESFKNDN